MNVRRKARETALQVLYRMDMAEDAASEDYGGEMDGLAEGTEARLYCEELIKGVVRNRAEVDRLIEANSDNWTVARMAVVDRNILRVAVYELKYSDVPYKAVIDEAVELAKRFGSAESGAFINGIVDNARKAIDREEPARSKLV